MKIVFMGTPEFAVPSLEKDNRKFMELKVYLLNQINQREEERKWPILQLRK